MKYGEKEMNNKSSPESDAGKGVAPWECDPRLIRAGGRSRGLRSKAWTGRGPGCRRFLRACKNPRQPRTSHGRHPFPQADGRREIKISLPTRENHKKEWTRYQGFPFPLGHDSEGVVKKRADILPTLATERKRLCE